MRKRLEIGYYIKRNYNTYLVSKIEYKADREIEDIVLVNIKSGAAHQPFFICEKNSNGLILPSTFSLKEEFETLISYRSNYIHDLYRNYIKYDFKSISPAPGALIMMPNFNIYICIEYYDLKNKIHRWGYINVFTGQKFSLLSSSLTEIKAMYVI